MTMYKDEEFQAEELSRCIDELNEGKHPIVDDHEMQELIELAAIVKNHTSIGISHNEIIRDTVESLALEMGDKKRKRRNRWWYSGMAGTVAAVLIVMVLQINSLQLFDKSGSQQFGTNSGPNSEIAQFSGQAVDIKSDNPVLPSKVAKVVPEMRKNNQLEQVEDTKQQNTQKDIIVAKAEKTAERKEADTHQINQRKLLVMTLPGQTAQKVIVDESAGIIRQVYNQGTKDEFIITQKVNNEKKSLKSEPQISAASLEEVKVRAVPKEHSSSSNKISVKINNYEVTIEGEKTEAELNKIAESMAEQYK